MMMLGTIFCLSLIHSPLIIGSINAFGILWAGIIWMLAGLIAGGLVAIPFYFIVLSTQEQYSYNNEVAIRVTMFVVAGFTLAGLLVGAYQEYNKQANNRGAYLPENVVQLSYLVSEVMPNQSFNE